MDLTVTHHSESKLPRLFVTIAQAHGGNSDKHIILLEFYRSSFRAFRGIDHVGLSIAVDDLEAA